MERSFFRSFADFFAKRLASMDMVLSVDKRVMEDRRYNLQEVKDCVRGARNEGLCERVSARILHSQKLTVRSPKQLPESSKQLPRRAASNFTARDKSQWTAFRADLSFGSFCSNFIHKTNSKQTPMRLPESLKQLPRRAAFAITARDGSQCTAFRADSRVARGQREIF